MLWFQQSLIILFFFFFFFTNDQLCVTDLYSKRVFQSFYMTSTSGTRSPSAYGPSEDNDRRSSHHRPLVPQCSRWPCVGVVAIRCLVSVGCSLVVIFKRRLMQEDNSEEVSKMEAITFNVKFNCRLHDNKLWYVCSLSTWSRSQLQFIG